MKEFKALPPFEQNKIDEELENLINLRKEITKALPKNNILYEGMRVFPEVTKEFIMILTTLNTTNDLNEADKRHFNFVNVPNFNSVYEYLSCEDKSFNIILAPYANIQGQFADLITHNPLYKRLEGLEELLKRENNTDVIAFTTDTTLIVAPNKSINVKQVLMILRLYHKLMCEKYSTPSEDYSNLLDALLNNKITEANKYLNNILNDPMLEDMKADNIGKIFVYSKQLRIENSIRHIENYRNDLTDIEKQYMEHQQRLSDELETLNSLMNIKDDTDTLRIGRHILNNPYITDVTRENSDKIILTYCAPLINFNEEEAERLIERSEDFEQKVLKILLHHSDKYTLYTECKIRVYSSMHVKAVTNVVSYEQFIGQPHLDNHACYGNHIDQIRSFAEHKNIVGVIDQTTEMVMNMNFKDGVVTQDLMRELKRNPSINTWLNNETGEYVSTLDIMEDIYGEA